MRYFQILHSPLAGTAGVLAALGLLAIPLHRLTSVGPAPPVLVAPAQTSATGATHAVLRLKLLTPARSLRVKPDTGKPLLDLTKVAAGESE